MREPLRMSQSPVETFQHIIGAKYEIGHIHEGKRFSLTLTNSSDPQGGTTAQCPRSPSQTVICPAGRKWECVSEHPVSPAVWEAAKKAHFSLSLSRVLKSELHNWGTVSIWAWNGMYQRDTDDTNYIRNSTGRLTHKPLRTPHLQIPWLAHGHLQHSVTFMQTHFHPMANSLSMVLTAAKVSFCR